MSSPELDALARGAHHLLASKYFQLAAFVMLVYDHLLTIPEEVENIWKRKFSGASILFLLNRYITPLQFVIILDAFHDPRWTKKACSNFVVFEGASTVALIAICQLIMILRVYALYRRSLVILIFLMVMWAAQIATSAVGLHTGFVAELPPVLTGCILTGASEISLVWVGPLVTDTTIFGLTLWRTRQYLRSSGKTPTIHVFIRDGSAYFLVIFAANLLNTLLFFLAEEGVKPIGASFSQLITAVMVSRIVLNLRSSSNSWGDSEESEASESDQTRKIRGRSVPPSFFSRTVLDLDDLSDNFGREHVVDTVISMSSMALRRKLDSIPATV